MLYHCGLSSHYFAANRTLHLEPGVAIAIATEQRAGGWLSYHFIHHVLGETSAFSRCKMSDGWARNTIVAICVLHDTPGIVSCAQLNNGILISIGRTGKPDGALQTGVG